jgi:hypothetical protein
MSTYYRVSDATLHELTADEYAARSQNKRADLRLYVLDAQPIPTATQMVDPGPVVVGPVEAHKTWVVRDKTANELLVDELAAEGPTIAQLIVDIKTQLDIDNTAYNAMTTADKFVVLRQDRRLLLRACRFLLRRLGALQP